MKIAVIGANGQLGSDLVEACLGRGHEVVALTHEEIQVEGRDSPRKAGRPCQTRMKHSWWASRASSRLPVMRRQSVQTIASWVARISSNAAVPVPSVM